MLKLLSNTLGTLRVYGFYGAMVAFAVLLTTWSPMLALQTWVVSTIALYCVFCAAYRAVATFERNMAIATSQSLVGMRQEAIERMRVQVADEPEITMDRSAFEPQDN